MSMCTVCEKNEVAVLKWGMCKRCYAREYQRDLRGRKEYAKPGWNKDLPRVPWTAHMLKQPSEVEFEKMFPGRVLIHHPCKFRLWDGDDIMTYTPDFYDCGANEFIEISRTRQAFHINKHKYVLFRKLFPLIKFRVLQPDGKEIRLNNYFLG